MNHQEPLSFYPLLIVTVCAFIVPLLASQFKRFPIPVVVGELIVGILLGKSGLNLISHDSWLQFLAEFGFAYLMFLSGLEVNFELLRGGNAAEDGEDQPPRWKRPQYVAITILLATFLLALLVAFGLQFIGLVQRPLLMSLVLSTTSLGLIVPVLKERGRTDTLLGQTLLLSALLADFVTMFMITILAALLLSGLSFKLFLGLLILVAFVIALRIAKILSASSRLRELLDDVTSTSTQIQVRGSLALMLVFVAISEKLGTEVILGAFLAGVLLSLLTGSRGSELHSKLEALGFGFFIPIFFIMVGVKFDLQALIHSPDGLILAPILIVSAFVIKIVAALPLRLIVPWRETLAGGFLLSSRLSLIIAAAEIGTRMGLFTEDLRAAIICVALVTCVAGPLGFQLIIPGLKKQARSALIVGGGVQAFLLADRLASQFWSVTMMVRETSIGKETARPEVKIITADGSKAEDLKQAGLENVEVVVAATSSDEMNEQVCRIAAQVGSARRMALVQDEEISKRLREEKVTVVSNSLSTLIVLEGLVIHPAVFRMLTDQNAEKQIVEAVLSRAAMVGRAIKDLRWPGDVLVLSLQRDDEVLIPNGQTVLERGDLLIFIGSPDHLRKAVRMVSRG